MINKKKFIGEKEAENVFAHNHRFFFDSARTAFLELLSQLNLKSEESILMPAYIGQSIREGSGVFDPIRQTKTNVLFYGLNDDLSVNVDDFLQKLNDNSGVKAVFVIHYFGFVQPDIERISDICKEKNIILIEDCAHSYSSCLKNKNIGTFGDFALFSLHKVFACKKGGFLQVNNNNDFSNKLKSNIDCADLVVFSQSDPDLIAAKRRKNFEFYLNNLKENSKIKFLFNELKPGVVPLNFPIVVNYTDRFSFYNRLLEHGIPVVSLWYNLINEIDKNLYKNTWNLSEHILNLPVHQDLSLEDIKKIANIINDLTEKKFLILGGKPAGTIDIVNYVQSRGYQCIVCDYLPKSQSPAKQIADASWDYSTADIDDIVNRAKQENITAVFTGIHEFNLRQCSVVAKKLNVPFYASDYEMIITSDKRKYKDMMSAFGISLIPEYKIESTGDLPQNIVYPILLKPVDSTGSYGLQICYSDQDVRAKIQDCLKYSDSKKFIAEQYIQDKEEITTVYIIKDGVPYLASVADRIVKSIDDSVIPLPVQYIWNSKYLDLYKQTIDSKMYKVIKKIGLRNGMLFIQSIVKDTVIMPYDIGFRLSGTQEHVILETMCGYNPLKLLTDYAMTGIFGDDKLVSRINPRFNTCAAQITFLIHPGTIAKFVGLESVEKNPNVIRTIKNKMEGDTIPENAYGTLNQVALRVFIKSETKDELYKNIKQIRESIKILSPDGTDLVIKIDGDLQ